MSRKPLEKELCALLAIGVPAEIRGEYWKKVSEFEIGSRR